jgi:polysaccharide transporter, PST family
MVNLIKENSLKKNILSWYLIQTSQFIVPLIVYPHLIVKLGFETFGLFALGQSWSFYISVITEYGFNSTGTREISMNRHNQESLTQTVSSIFLARFFLFIPLFLGSLVLTFFIPFLQKFFLPLWFILPLGQILQHSYYFQGIENTMLVATTNGIARLLSIPFFFLFIENKTDLALSILFFITPQLISGLILFSFIIKTLPFYEFLKKTPWCFIQNRFKTGVSLFSSQFFIHTYVNSSPIIIAFFYSDYLLGLFSAAEKLIRATQGFIGPISLAFFPRVTYLLQHSPSLARPYIQKAFLLQTALGATASLLLFLLSSQFSLYLQQEDPMLVTLIRVLSPIPFIASISNILSNQILIGTGSFNLFMKITGITAFAGLSISFILTYFFGILGSSIALIISELLAMTLLMISAKKILEKLQ